MPPDEARECAQGLVRLSCPGEHGCHIRVEGYCDAALRIAGRVLFGRARLKSYSGRMSSTPTLRGVASLALALFIVSPLTACGLPCADQANRFATFRKHDREDPLSLGLPEQHVTVLVLEAAWIAGDPAEWIAERSHGLLEGDAEL